MTKPEVLPRQEQRGRGHVLRAPHPADGDERPQRRGEVRRHGGGDGPRRHRVDGDAVRRQFPRQEEGEGVDAGLGGAVGRVARPRLLGRVDPGARVAAVLADDRAQVDDAAVALPPHRRDHRLAGQEGALEVHVQHAVPLGLGQRRRGPEGDDAGDVHQDVQPAEGRERSVHRRVHLGAAGDVQRRLDPAPADRLDRGRDGARVGAVRQAKRRALLREAPRHGAADAAGGARDQGDPSLQPHHAFRGGRAASCPAMRPNTSPFSTDVAPV